MEENKLSAHFPFLRSCKNELEKPIEGELKGQIPKWLKGNLIRNGSGLLEVGPDRYEHLFDGLSLLHKFSFRNGKVNYFQRFLRSDAYKRNMKANRIVVNEFGTPGVPDPCKTIFQRFNSFFNPVDEMTDNDLVNVILYADQVYACSESNFIWRIDPETLDSLEKVKISQHVPVNAAIAHAHQENDGTVYNVGSTYGSSPTYKILKFPPKEDAFKKASVEAVIPAAHYFNLSYHHSFGMAENYFIFVEQPLYVNILRLTKAHLLGKEGGYASTLSWDDNRPARFHVVRRSDGKLLDTVYQSKGFFLFHHINAYEEDGQLIVDLCAYNSGRAINTLYVKALQDYYTNPNPPADLQCFSKRYILPLNVKDKKASETTNLVTIPKSSATAYKLKDGSIYCNPESLTGGAPWSTELPRINYEKFNGKKYRYTYTMATNLKEAPKQTQVLKIDVETKTCTSWFEVGTIPSEPIFVADPNVENPDEDSGVLLVSLLYTEDEKKVSMLVLDAKTMEEIGRVTFLTKSSVPGTFHGEFITDK